jgi:hypothetical protein
MTVPTFRSFYLELLEVSVRDVHCNQSDGFWRDCSEPKLVKERLATVTGLPMTRSAEEFQQSTFIKHMPKD